MISSLSNASITSVFFTFDALCALIGGLTATLAPMLCGRRLSDDEISPNEFVFIAATGIVSFIMGFFLMFFDLPVGIGTSLVVTGIWLGLKRLNRPDFVVAPLLGASVSLEAALFMAKLESAARAHESDQEMLHIEPDSPPDEENFFAGIDS